MVDLAPQAGAQAPAPAVPSMRRYYVLGILTAVYALNFLDRTIFNVLIEPIKKEFLLSDTTMGLLAGFGFVLFYSALGIPIARLADRLNRRNIVAASLCVLELDDVLLRSGLERDDAGAGKDRRRHRRIRRHPRFAVAARRPLRQERAPPRARHLCDRHLSRRVPRLFSGRLCQPALRLADGLLLGWPARDRAGRAVVADDRRAETRRHGGNLHPRAARTDAALPCDPAELRHRAGRLLSYDLHQLRHRGLDPAIPGARASSDKRRDRHLCRHLQGPVRDGGHAGRRARGGQDQPPRRPLEIMGAGDHVRPCRAGLCGVHADT